MVDDDIGSLVMLLQYKKLWGRLLVAERPIILEECPRRCPKVL